MNEVMQTLLNRRSVRAYEDKPVEPGIRAQVLQAALRAPTAGNMMLYSILDITDPALKERLAVTCDDQPFIARAPMVWIFLADYQRWNDYFHSSGVPQLCEDRGLPLARPREGDLFLACCDALIAAQNAVVAAESLGLGSCYIGDIMEQYETHRDLLALPPLVFPICMLVFGYPTPQQRERTLTPRFDEEFIVFENGYRRLSAPDFERMFAERQARLPRGKVMDGIENPGQEMYLRKFNADFSVEMRRSVREMLRAWGE